MQNLGQALTIIAQARASLEIGRYYDSFFDGGEFSGPAHDRLEPKVMRLARRRAKAVSGLSRRGFNRVWHRASVRRAVGQVAELIVERELRD
jgi:hypothetical protein